MSNSSFQFIDPSTQTPLFTAEWITCAYPVSDLYATSPRYLYYVLLVMVFLTQWHSWLANVFLGGVATYAGTAAIEAFILIAHKYSKPPKAPVSIPYIDPASVEGNSTLGAIPNLVTGRTSVDVAPAALDFDIDAVIAITVTGYLMMLPMHCWSSAVRANRARHFLILLWNALMFAGMICSIVLWPSLFDSPLQYRFCYPTILDSSSVTSDGRYSDPNTQLQGSWNDTIWGIFSNFSRAANMNNNCFYPCFNTTQVLRREQTLMVDLQSNKSPRLSTQLFYSGYTPTTHLDREFGFANLMYTALVLTTIVMCMLLVFVLTPICRFIRVPVAKPKELFWTARKELFHVLWNDFKHGLGRTAFAIASPRAAHDQLRQFSRRKLRKQIFKVVRFQLDIVALLMLFVAMFLTPATIVIFIAFIEWYIHRDLVSQEAAQQVGQWTTSVSVALVLISALVLRLKYTMASRNELLNEIADTREHLAELEKMLSRKEVKEVQIAMGMEGVELRPLSVTMVEERRAA